MPQFEKMPGATMNATAPEGWDEETQGPCHTLSVRAEEHDGVRYLVHQMSFSEEEIAILVNGGRLRYGIADIYQGRQPVIWGHVVEKDAL